MYKVLSSSQAPGNQSYFLKAFWRIVMGGVGAFEISLSSREVFHLFPFLIVPVYVFLSENQWESLLLGLRTSCKISSSSVSLPLFFLLSMLPLSLPFFPSFFLPSSLPPSLPSLSSLSQLKCYLLSFFFLAISSVSLFFRLMFFWEVIEENTIIGWPLLYNIELTPVIHRHKSATGIHTSPPLLDYCKKKN